MVNAEGTTVQTHRTDRSAPRQACKHQHRDRQHPQQCKEDPSWLRKCKSENRAATNSVRASHLGMTLVLSTTTEVAAMNTDMPTKAKQYIHPESAKERKPCWASGAKFSKRASVAGWTISTAAPASISAKNNSPHRVPRSRSLRPPPRHFAARRGVPLRTIESRTRLGCHRSRD